MSDGAWRVEVTVTDLDAARAALVDALLAGAPASRVRQLLLDWCRIARTHDLQLQERHGDW